MEKRSLYCALGLCAAVAILAPPVVQAQTCGPLNNGRVANVFYEGTALFFEPVVEYRTMTLTIGGPCEDIVKVFGPKDEISFDIREIERVQDGQYTWRLSRVANVDPSVQKALLEARGTGEEDDLWWNLFQKGLIPDGPYVDSGSFAVERGQIIGPDSGEEKSAILGERGAGAGGSSSAIQTTVAGSLPAGGSSGDSGEPVLSTKDTVLTNANGVIRNSLCVGFDCLNNNTYSDTTILLTENNTRIKFDDTSSLSGFPNRDWEIEANSNLSGGQSYLGFNDCGGSSGGGCASDLVFAVEANVRQHALYVESDGDVGLGTNNPVVRLHVVDGDSPALRLEQDGSSGFAPQTWDVAGNETNFFVRDATNGSTLPFRIQPGASSNRIFIDDDDDVGVGTSSPARALHVVDMGAPDNTVLEIQNNGATRLRINNSSNGEIWNIGHQSPGGSGLVFSDVGDAVSEMLLDVSGNMTIAGSLTVGPGGCTGCDLVFSPDYEIESIEEHAAYMWKNSHLPGVGPTPEDQPMNLSQKTGGILNELEKAHIYIEQLHDDLASLRAQLNTKSRTLEEVLQRLERIEGEH